MVGKFGKGGDVDPTALERMIRDLETDVDEKYISRDDANGLYETTKDFNKLKEAVFGKTEIPGKYNSNPIVNRIAGETGDFSATCDVFLAEGKGAGAAGGGVWVGGYIHCSNLGLASATINVTAFSKVNGKSEWSGWCDEFHGNDNNLAGGKITVSEARQLVVPGDKDHSNGNLNNSMISEDDQNMEIKDLNANKNVGGGMQENEGQGFL